MEDEIVEVKEAANASGRGTWSLHDKTSFLHCHQTQRNTRQIRKTDKHVMVIKLIKDESTVRWYSVIEYRADTIGDAVNSVSPCVLRLDHRLDRVRRLNECVVSPQRVLGICRCRLVHSHVRLNRKTTLSCGRIRRRNRI